MGDLGPRVGARNELLRSLDRGEKHVDGDVSVGVAVHLDPGAMHPLDPRVEIVLRLGDVAAIGRLDAWVGHAEGHCSLGKRPVDRLLRGRAQLDPFVAEAGR